MTGTGKFSVNHLWLFGIRVASDKPITALGKAGWIASGDLCLSNDGWA